MYYIAKKWFTIYIYIDTHLFPSTNKKIYTNMPAQLEEFCQTKSSFFVGSQTKQFFIFF